MVGGIILHKAVAIMTLEVVLMMTDLVSGRGIIQHDKPSQVLGMGGCVVEVITVTSPIL